MTTAGLSKPVYEVKSANEAAQHRIDMHVGSLARPTDCKQTTLCVGSSTCSIGEARQTLAEALEHIVTEVSNSAQQKRGKQLHIPVFSPTWH